MRFPRQLRAEWTKFRSVRGWVLAVLGATLITAALGPLDLSRQPPPNGGPGPAVVRGPDGRAVNDSFYFVRRDLTGDGTVTARITGLSGIAVTGPDRVSHEVQGWAKAGIIVKENLTPGSRYAAIMLTGAHGVRFQDNYIHDTAADTISAMAPSPSTPSSPSSSPWLRLTRTADTITGDESADGVHWQHVGSVRIPGLDPRVPAGLFVTSPSTVHVAAIDVPETNPAAAVGTFGPIALTGAWSPEPWTGAQFGGLGTSGSYPPDDEGGSTGTADTALTLTGAGDIAPVVGGTVLGVGVTVDGFVGGTFAGLVALVAVAALVVTAEYRRGLIRITLAACPRPGCVLAAKTTIVAGLGFTSGVLGATVAILAGRHIADAHHVYVVPVSTPTELRVAIGTGLLSAAMAVLALAVGTVLRSGASAITLVVVGTVLPYLLAVSPGLPTSAAQWLLRVTPAAGFAIRQSLPRFAQVDSTYIPPDGYFPLAPWTGLAVLCGYCVVALVAAAFLVRRRDA
ncbi:hypothetical protein GCM10009839_02640 [Catenulispora yoronensis]|uniref:ABC transporter permease n=1 Tax=Catenulispora yoronensis TaxID=450799 RepID=A0ABP5EZA5_9ACTN